MAFCRVSYSDIEAIEHAIEVEADSLYEAVAKAVHRFRENNWEGHPPGPGCAFRVRVQPQTPISYTVSLNKVEEFARFGAVKGPKDLLRRKRLRELLGVEE